MENKFVQFLKMDTELWAHLRAMYEEAIASASPPPLFEAILNGEIGRVKKLLEKGEDTDKKWANGGYTPLLSLIHI